MTVRRPAVAGAFYPGDQDALRAAVTALLADVPASTEPLPKAVIAPHAGYVYSGQPAAAAFASLRNAGQRIERVVLIGPAHFVPFRGIAVPAFDAMATPLGEVPVDPQALVDILDLSFVVCDDRPHAPEHSLEVELPFLQVLLGSFAAIPLVVGDARPEDVAAVLNRLWNGPETLIVASSDLSHFHDYGSARRIDLATAEAIERGDFARLGPADACGYLAIAGLLIEAGHRGMKARRLSLCNSGDTAGSRDRVVGYGAWAFASE
jgi:AmmeMemoRadiSam system protein B